MTRTYLVTGAASGIGRATADRLRAQGHTVIGADLKGADIEADLATAAGRAALVAAATGLTGGRLDAVVACAGIAAFDPLTVRVNHFGAVATLEGLRPLLAAGSAPRAVVGSSVASIHPADPAIVDAALAGDEEAAAEAAMREVVDASVPMPLHGHATAAQVAPLLDWLTAPDNTHVTGQVVFIDGGADAVLRGDGAW